MPYTPSTAEAVLLALKSALSGLGAVVHRNIAADTVVAVPAGGLIILRDGDPGEPEVVLGLISYHYEHEVEVEIFAQGPRAGLDERFDTLRQAVGVALLADRTLGGVVMWVEPAAAVSLDLPSAGDTPIKAATIPVRLTYVTDNPLN